MSWLTSDRYQCLDCGQFSIMPTRWFGEARIPACTACGSAAIVRKNTLLRHVRDLFILTNAC